ncbi:MAG: hypothetical protein JRH20_03140 [Deltaproteobacteria bacterium]|nr:hypothetical protein [Deltaproteobacteria bacterium]
MRRTRQYKHPRITTALLLAFTLLMASSCHWVAAYEQDWVSADASARDARIVDFNSEKGDGSADAEVNVEPFTLEGEVDPLREGHSPVITVHGAGYAVAWIDGDQGVSVQKWDVGSLALITYPGPARTPAITSTVEGLFVAWSEKNLSTGLPASLWVAKDLGDTQRMGGTYDNPRFFTADGTLHILASTHLGLTPCTPHTKMLQIAYDGQAWGASINVYPPESTWSTFSPLPLACPDTCSPSTHGLLWLYNNEATISYATDEQQSIEVRFKPVTFPATASQSLYSSIPHTILGKHPYHCSEPNLPRRRPDALDSDGKIFVAWSDWVSGTSGTGVHLASLTPGDPLPATTPTLVSTDSLFPQLLLLEGVSEVQRLLIYVRQDGGQSTIMARFFDASGELLDEEIPLLERELGFEIQSLDVVVKRAPEGQELGIVFSEENTMVDPAFPARNVHFFRVRYNPVP